MSDEILGITDKPAEILEIEKIYGIVLQGAFKTSAKYDKPILLANSYLLDSENNIVGLNIHEESIEDVGPIVYLKKLKYLGLTKNRIENIFPLAVLVDLKWLYLGGNKIKDVSALSKLKNLSELAIWENPISDFSPIAQLSKLEKLYCQETKLNNLTLLEGLKKMNEFIATGNNISDVLILSSLNIIKGDFQGNAIRLISKEVAERYDWLRRSFPDDPYIALNSINLSDNPMEFPPESVIRLGPEVTKEYYDASDRFGHASLSEGRVIVIGDGSSGKSSLIEKVLHNTFTLGREQTNGIKINNFYIPHPEDNRQLNVHIWDFGGQEIQHAVHKFFFTEGCLYVLVLDNRKEEEPEYWLQQIESLGGKAPVLVVFNKQDENVVETADRKFLKEKYNNIVGFYNTSCKTGFGIQDFKNSLQNEVVKLRTVAEQFPNNWLSVKRLIEEYTSGSQHYLSYEAYQEICKKNHLVTEQAQKLLLKYFNTIGTVTWFGEDVHLQFMHILNPAWITQGVYKIITAKKTANLLGQIEVKDFKELLQPIDPGDYAYDEKHYGYILAMMKKFDLCYSPDDKHLLIPSAFGKMPKIEYSDFRGESVRTYALQFIDYMPMALIHRFIAQKMADVVDNNYWYSGIVIKDNKTNTVAMVHADREAKRINIRIKGESKLGLWEYIRRDFANIASSYAKIPYEELVVIDNRSEHFVNYSDVISHIQAGKFIYFHTKLQRDFNVGFLMSLFEPIENTKDKISKGQIVLNDKERDRESVLSEIPPLVINILNNNSPTLNTQINAQVNIDIDIQSVYEIGSDLKGNADYLIDALGDSNKALTEALQKVMQFADDARAVRNSGAIKEKGWGKKLRNVLKTLGAAGEQLKNIQDGGETMKSIMTGIKSLADHLHLHDIVSWFAGS